VYTISRNGFARKNRERKLTGQHKGSKWMLARL
jgi:hypothetical protein